MKRQFLFGTVLAAAMAVGVGAQTPQTPPPSQTPTPTQAPTSSMDRSSGMGKSVTLTGCVEKAGSSSSAAGTAGTTGASASQFVLKNVAAGGSSASSTTGTSGSTLNPSWQNGLNLSAGSEDLEKHLNKKVEIKGTVDTPASSAAGAAASSSASDMATLKVSSIKDLADTCSAGGQ